MAVGVVRKPLGTPAFAVVGQWCPGFGVAYGGGTVKKLSSPSTSSLKHFPPLSVKMPVEVVHFLLPSVSLALPSGCIAAPEGHAESDLPQTLYRAHTDPPVSVPPPDSHTEG